MDAPLTFAEIYRLHASAVFRLAWMLTGNRADAEDLCADAFARALAGEERIAQATVRSYLYAIVRNLAASRHRRPKVEWPADDALLAGVADGEPGPERQAELRQHLMRAGSGLAALRDSDRQLLLLSGLDGLSAGEIADALALQPGHVRVRLHRARKQLASLIDPPETSHGPA